jgi:hypothetical protein
MVAVMTVPDLDRLADALRAGTLTADSQRAWADRLDAAAATARRDRDAEAQNILHLWRQHPRYAHLTVNGAAEAIARAIAEYNTTAWRFDRREARCPEQYAGTPREFAYHFLNAHGLPLGARRIRQILASFESGCQQGALDRA